MSQRKISLAPGEYYHVYNRGNSKQVIYTSNDEYERFQNLLYVANGSKHFEVRGMKHADMLDFKSPSTNPLTDHKVSNFERK